MTGWRVFDKARDAQLLDLGPDGWRLRDSAAAGLAFVMKMRFGDAAPPNPDQETTR